MDRTHEKATGAYGIVAIVEGTRRFDLLSTLDAGHGDEAVRIRGPLFDKDAIGRPDATSDQAERAQHELARLMGSASPLAVPGSIPTPRKRVARLRYPGQSLKLSVALDLGGAL